MQLCLCVGGLSVVDATRQVLQHTPVLCGDHCQSQLKDHGQPHAGHERHTVPVVHAAAAIAQLVALPQHAVWRQGVDGVALHLGVAD